MGELRWGPSGAAAPPRQASFIVSGKQLTERKPSSGVRNAAWPWLAQIWVVEGGKPLPRARGLPPPRMRWQRGFRAAGEGAAAGLEPCRKSHHPRGWGELSARWTNMQIYVSEHANKQHLSRSLFFCFFFFFLFLCVSGLGTFFFPGDSSSTQAGLGMWVREGIREGSGTEGKGGKAPSPSAPTWQDGAGAGGPVPISQNFRGHAQKAETHIT